MKPTSVSLWALCRCDVSVCPGQVSPFHLHCTPPSVVAKREFVFLLVSNPSLLGSPPVSVTGHLARPESTETAQSSNRAPCSTVQNWGQGSGDSQSSAAAC